MSHEQGRRRHPRKPHLIPTLLELEGSRSAGRIVNLSPTGLGIVTGMSSLPRPNDRIRVVFSSEGEEISVGGHVRWSSPLPGGKLNDPAIGIELIDPSPEYLRFFEHLVPSAEC